MLPYVDTAMGFGVVMLVVSLLITILTQIISALVNHRGSNLLWGIKTIFANIDPKQFPQLTAKADAVAQAVLTHCLISDSWFSSNKVGQWLAEKVPVLGRLLKRYQLASAIRPAELKDILKHLADNTFAENEQELAAEIHKMLGVAEVAAGAAAGAGAQGAANAINAADQAVKDAAVKAEAQ